MTISVAPLSQCRTDLGNVYTINLSPTLTSRGTTSSIGRRSSGNQMAVFEKPSSIAGSSVKAGIPFLQHTTSSHKMTSSDHTQLLRPDVPGLLSLTGAIVGTTLSTMNLETSTQRQLVTSQLWSETNLFERSSWLTLQMPNSKLQSSILARKHTLGLQNGMLIHVLSFFSPAPRPRTPKRVRSFFMPMAYLKLLKPPLCLGTAGQIYLPWESQTTLGIHIGISKPPVQLIA
mmetsp:Transcript_939/g.1397  ORF Transcript_939/g.1397 Transcript_939/m.1397 type:complete len:231 (+) Transcript_939:280-972(+)